MSFQKGMQTTSIRKDQIGGFNRGDKMNIFEAIDEKINLYDIEFTNSLRVLINQGGKMIEPEIYSDDELSKMGYKKLGRLMGTGFYHGDEYKRISYYYDKAKTQNRY